MDRAVKTLAAILLSQFLFTHAAGANPRSFTCSEPLPEFTLGPDSDPTDGELAKLCSCVWSKLPAGGWEREVSEKIRNGEDPGWRAQGFIPRFYAALDACGGRDL